MLFGNFEEEVIYIYYFYFIILHFKIPIFSGKNRYKPLTRSQCDAIEKDYNFYTREKSIGKRTHSKRNIVTEKQTIVVDYEQEKMFR